MTYEGRCHEQTCIAWQRWKVAWISGVDYTDEFYNYIYQDPDYEDKEQQDIDLEADDEISKGEIESLEARTQDG